MKWFAPLLILFAMAGCVGGPGATKGLDAFADGASLVGLVTNDELLPIEGAQVRLAETQRIVTTDAAGRFEFLGVPAGQWVLAVEAPGHAPKNETVAVQPEAEVELRVRLERLATSLPYSVPFIFKGSYDCAHEIPIWTGDCFLLYKSATGQNDTYTSETFHFRLPVLDKWESVVLELAWSQGPNNQLDGMRVYLENGNGTDVGHSYKVGRSEGPENPLRLVVQRGETHPRADTYPGTQTRAFIPDTGELSQVRVFPRGKLYGQTSQVRDSQGRPLLGLGAGLDIDFTAYATVFYHERAPDSFTGMPDK